MTSTMTPEATDASAFDREAAALLSADSPHLPRVLDVVALGEHRELLLEPLDGPNLDELLARRRRLTEAEAVTVVIGVVRAVAALHAAGFAGAVVDAVRFDSAARPVLVGTSTLVEIVAAGRTAADDDWRAVAELAVRLGLLARGRSGGPAHTGLGLAFATLTASETTHTLDQLEEALFELAEPAPVRLMAAAEPPPPPPTLAPGSRAGTRPSGRPRKAHRKPSGSALVEAFDAGPSALLAEPIGRLRERVAVAAGLLSGRGRLLVVGGLVAAVLVVAAVVLMPDEGRQAAHPSTPASGRAVSSPARASGSASPTADADAAVLRGDDPVGAATVLLDRRDACLAASDERRAACLAPLADGEASDLATPARPLAALTPSLLERTGDSALVALTPKQGTDMAPASALLMRTEAGWRLRQLYEN
ncbi:protein kinase family protein [Gryllotalpicola ginsengisoli]|uniref:hypothetical protein n=1 Tax=Gryllotalpicola ginsengisoli TaxID=444608 RepID=UPI0003B660F7|nr:hypothetical protein [Gryllotalpicola ginsengisoli]